MFTMKSTATLKSRTEKLTRDIKRTDKLDIKDSFSSYRQLERYEGCLLPFDVEFPLLTRTQLENNLGALFNLVKDGQGEFYIGDLNIYWDIKDAIIEYWDSYPTIDYITVVAPYINKVQRLAQKLHLNYDLSFSDWCEAISFIDNNRHLTNPELVWLANVPEWLHKVLDNNINKYTNLTDLFYLVDELVNQFNFGYYNQDDVINVVNLIYSNKVSEVNEFITSSITIDYSLLTTLLPILVKLSKKNSRASLQYTKLSKQPYWCDDNVWDLFKSTKAYKGAEIVHQIAAELVRQYDPSKYFYVCMARDAVPLYVLLFQSNYDCMLGVFSRSQIGDDNSIKLLKDEIALASELTGKLPLIVDIQGRGTIYDYLRKEGINCEMIFGVCSGNCRYPLLISDESIGDKAIKYCEKLPQNNGRAEGVYQRSRCGGDFQDTLIAWGTRDPNAMGEELKDWEILQFRGLFMETMGVSHIHAGMIGNDNQQRMWGVRKKVVDFGIGIKVKDAYLEDIESTRFKTQHEVGHSSGHYDNYDRLRDEECQFGAIGIRTVFGIVEEDKYEGYQYGNNFCKLSGELTPYITLTTKDSLWSDHDHYPLAITSELPYKEGNYRELQINTLVTWDSVLEVISC